MSEVINTKVKPWKLFTQEERQNGEYLVSMREAYEKTHADPGNNTDYVQIVNAIAKLRKKKEAERAKLEQQMRKESVRSSNYNLLNAAEKLSIAQGLLNPKFRRHRGKSQLQELICIKDEANKLVARVLNPKAIREQLADAIAKQAVESGEVYPPWFIDELVRFWQRYGDSIDNFEVYGGFEPNTWCLGRSLYIPVAGPMPTWERFLSRMNDPEAFAAWIYGMASKRYRGRQILWLKGENGEDGKSYVQALLARNLFPHVTHPMMNSALSEGASRFIGAEFENKWLAYWDDCNNTMALFREDVKALSAGADGNEARVEHKGVMAYQTQLEARLWINSNYAPSVSQDNFIRSRLLYVCLDVMREKPDINIAPKFEAELPAFLEYGQRMFAKLCPDSRKIEQSVEAEEEIDELADNFDDHYESIFAQEWQQTTEFEDSYVTCVDIQTVLKREGLRDNLKQGDWYRWLEKRKGLKRCKIPEGDGFRKVVRGMRARSAAPRFDFGNTPMCKTGT